MAAVAEGEAVKVRLIHIMPPNAHSSYSVRASQIFRESMVGISYKNIETNIVTGNDLVETILKSALPHEEQIGSDLIVIGATREPLLRNLFMGSIPAQIAQRANVTVVMVKRRNSQFRSFLRQTIVQPEGNKPTLQN